MRLKLTFNRNKSYVILSLLLLVGYYLVSYYGISSKSYNPEINKIKLYNKIFYDLPYGKSIFNNFSVTPKPHNRKEWIKLGNIVNKKIKIHFENEFKNTKKGMISYYIYEKTDVINEDFKNYTKFGSIAISSDSGDPRTVTLSEAGEKHLLVRINMNKIDCSKNIVGIFFHHSLFGDTDEYFIKEYNDIDNCKKDKK